MTDCEKREPAWLGEGACGKPSVARIQADGVVGNFVCAAHCDQALRKGKTVVRLRP